MAAFTFRNDTKHGGEKNIYLAFSHRNLCVNYSEIKKQVESVLNCIEEETELIKQDNLARGRLVRTKSLSANIADNRNSTMDFGLESGFKEDDPPEWWGDITLFNTDFISSIHIFPWMPTAIADMQF
jgi:hypothetical protein